MRPLAAGVFAAMLPAAAVAADQIDFDRDVRPILARHCLACHGGVKRESGLSLKTHSEAFQPADSGSRAIEPGVPENSELIRRVTSDGDQRMPPQGDGLSDAEVSLLRRWIEAGVPWPQHWSFRPLAKPSLPAVQHVRWVHNPIDHFVLAKLERHRLEPSPPADRSTLIRRIAFGITGLPATLEEMRRFREGDIEEVVDWYLGSPAYGERWAKYWLDAAGYADSNGYFHADTDRPLAWKYRDWVVQSLNTDQPFDDFVSWQLAGDHLAGYQPEVGVTPEMVPKLVATHFLRNAPDGTGESDGNPQELQRDRLVVIEGNLANLAASLLGITIGCARCHDHPFEPISQQEYYELQAVLTGAYPDDESRWIKPQDRLVVAATAAEQQAHREQIQPLRQQLRKQEQRHQDEKQAATKRVVDRRLAKLDPDRRREAEQILALPPHARSGEQQTMLAAWNIKSEYDDDKLTQLDARFAEVKGRIEQSVAELQRRLPADLPRIAAVWELPGPNVPHYLKQRGVYTRPGAAVEPGVPHALAGDAYAYSLRDVSDRRLAFAEWVTSPHHPLLARVTVNRIWQQHFGRGLVPTTDNLGVSGERPSHPQLLDYLAAWFVENDWSRKALHRLIVGSATYRQANTLRTRAYAADPSNRLLWRWSLRRLDAESIRDAMLSIAGLLDRSSGGEYVPVKTVGGVNVTDSEQGGAYRRSLYIQQRRTHPLTMMVQFDSRPIISNCTRRTTSTVPLQSLTLLNSRFARACGRGFAERLASRGGEDRIATAFLLAVGRPPRVIERAAAERFLQRQQSLYASKPAGEDESWADFCQMIFAANTFLYVE